MLLIGDANDKTGKSICPQTPPAGRSSVCIEYLDSSALWTAVMKQTRLKTDCLAVSLYSASDILEMFSFYAVPVEVETNNNNFDNAFSALKIVKYFMFDNHVLYV